MQSLTKLSQSARSLWIPSPLLGAYVIAHSAVLKAVDEFVRMREITRSVVKVALNVFLQSLLSMTIFRIELQRLSI